MLKIRNIFGLCQKKTQNKQKYNNKKQYYKMTNEIFVTL